jgi:DNA-binding CsgD family transcriptional regulator
MESRFFVGRERERDLFIDFLTQEYPHNKILNVHGTGGIGKSFLLDEYRRLAEVHLVPFLLLDSNDFPHTPQGLCEKILALLQMPEVEITQRPIEDCLNGLNKRADNTRLVVAIDTYEELGELDWWLRESFISHSGDNVLFIISGRHALQGSWAASPVWRSLVKPVPVDPFDSGACTSYAEQFGIVDEATLRNLYAFTLGHPLTLSLTVGLSLKELFAEKNEDQWEDLFRELTYRWLREVPDESLRNLVEAASLVRNFDQELLEWMIGESVSGANFRRLTDLSFIRPGKGGYRIHALLRTTLSIEIRTRTPKRFKQLRHRSIAYYHREIVTPSAEQNMTDTIANLIFGLEDSVLLSTFLEDTPHGEYEYETVNEDSLRQAEQHIQDVMQAEADYERSYFNPQTGQLHQMDIPAHHDRIAFGNLEPAKLITFGPDTVRMIKNRQGVTVGLAVFIPIHRDSLPYLQVQPVSRHYFNTLDPAQLEEYRTSPDQPAGRFIYHIDLRKDDSIAARAALMRLLISLLLKQGMLMFSSPLPYHQEITKRMGFQQVEGATHYDFGEQIPSPTFMLDIRGERQKAYFDRWVQSAGLSLTPELPDNLFGFTSKEREVALLVLSTDSIAEIANKLNVTQVAVKKHLGRIYKKAGVARKTQLLKKLMEL